MAQVPSIAVDCLKDPGEDCVDVGEGPGVPPQLTLVAPADQAQQHPHLTCPSH